MEQRELNKILYKKGYLQVSNDLIRHLGLDLALLLTNYIDKYYYFEKKNRLTDGGFFLPHQQIADYFRWTLRRVKQNKLQLEHDGFIKLEMQGVKGYRQKELIRIEWERILSLSLNPSKVTGLTTNLNPSKVTGLNPSKVTGLNFDNKINGENPEQSDIMENDGVLPDNLNPSKVTGLINNNTKEEADKGISSSSSISLKKNASSSINRDDTFLPINGKISPSQFNDFWELYPKKRNKGKTLTQWDRLCSLPEGDIHHPSWREIKRAIIFQKKSEIWQEPKFIPFPDNWLSQSRWLDDPNEMKIPKAKKNKPPIYDDGVKYVWNEEKQDYFHCISGDRYVP